MKKIQRKGAKARRRKKAKGTAALLPICLFAPLRLCAFALKFWALPTCPAI
jgi:hypothetical protein